MKKILVTGITGTVGMDIAKLLDKGKHPVKAAIRRQSIEKAKSVLGDGLEYVAFDFEKPETCAAAFKDVDRLFLMRPPAISNTKKYINPVIDAAIENGVEHIVFLSLLGVENNPIVPHYKIEKHILKKKISYTFLRPSFFMQNLSEFYREDIKLRNEIFVPAGKGKTSFIDCRDIAEIGAKALMEEGHRNKAYPLTGSEALDYFEVAEIFSEELGRKITYADPTPGEYSKRMKEAGVAKEFITVMQGIYFTARIGFAKKVTADTELLLGRPPITVRQFIKDYAHLWK
ncbi:MAG: SDR family oxidoreductase [Clostridia bacterium]|nr:SDR family oxidoreductase [Clostridia bacterium]